MTKNNINTELFNETDVIKSLRSKQDEELLKEVTNEPLAPVKSNRGRKKKYQTDEERYSLFA